MERTRSWYIWRNATCRKLVSNCRNSSQTFWITLMPHWTCVITEIIQCNRFIMSRVFDGLFHPQEIVAASYNSFHWHIRVRIVQINAANAKMSFTSDLTVIQRGFRNFFYQWLVFRKFRNIVWLRELNAIFSSFQLSTVAFRRDLAAGSRCDGVMV